MNGVTGTQIADAHWEFYGDTNYRVVSQLAADVDGDGRDDLLITKNSELTSFLFYGELIRPTDSNVDAVPARIAHADATIQTGESGAANAGDQNLDGYEDLLIGGYCPNNIYPLAGRGDDYPIYLFHGAP